MGKPVSFKTVEEKLNSVLPRFSVQKLFMGWAPGRELYEKTAELLAKQNIEFYLWLPVFSESGGLRSQSGLVDFQGRRPKDGRGHADEDFAFCCPNVPQNIQNVLDIFEKEFSSVPFTGVFLDKIRFPSFAQEDGHGFAAVFSCFCPHCLALYEKENIDIEELKNALLKTRALPAGPGSTSAPLGIRTYRPNGNYEFEDPGISKFFSLKKAFISQNLERLSSYFRGKGYSVGFDVFAPFLSPFVGQDLPALSGICDFIKPMIYRSTQAPAGLPFETEKLLAGTVGANAKGRGAFYEILGLDGEKKPFDLGFAAKELESLIAASACPIYAGVEINRKKGLAEVYPDYIEESLQAYSRAGVHGFALSWDLLDAPEENIACVARLL